MARAAFAALAALMITFSPDHSASVGLSVFSGFAIATGIVLLLASWLVYAAGTRWPAITLGVFAAIAGMASGIAGLRTATLFFSVVISWALVTGLVETIAGWLGRKRATSTVVKNEFRDSLTVGILTLALGVALLFVPVQYALQYYIEDAGQTFTLTGITIGVGLLGAYAALVAVFLAIAALSPRPASVESAQTEKPGGTA
nr:acyl-CoA synthetase [Microbacterium endophyticum]